MLVFDLRQALKSLLRRPLQSTILVLLLGVGVGATTAIFAVVKASILAPLPYPASERLMAILSAKPSLGVDMAALNYSTFLDYQKSDVFEASAALSAAPRAISVRLDEGNFPLRAEIITPGTLELLGISVWKGRAFTPEEQATRDSHPVALLTHQLWQSRFGADPEVLGRHIAINGTSYTVVGITPPGFTGIWETADLFLPVMMASSLLGPTFNDGYETRWMMGLGRLKPGVSQAKAQAVLATVDARLDQEFPAVDGYEGRLQPLHDLFYVEFEHDLLVLLAASGLVLFIACLNAAVLLLSRGVERQRELAIRTASGADSARLARQLLTESLVVGLAGAAVGAVLAYGGTSLARSMIPPDIFGSFVDIRVSPQILLLSLGLAIGCSLLFGLLPSVQAARPDLSAILREGDRAGTGRGTRRIQASLVVLEVALATALVAQAGLTVKSFQHISRSRPGFDTAGIVVAPLQVPKDRIQGLTAAQSYFDSLLLGVGGEADVESATLIGPRIPPGANLFADATVEDRLGDEGEDAAALRCYRHGVSPGYFATLGMTFLRGETFRDQQPGQVIISQSIAQRFWPDKSPIGRRIHLGPPDAENIEWLTIVGVVETARNRGFLKDPNLDLDIYRPLAAYPESSIGLLVRRGGATENLPQKLEEAIHRVDPEISIGSIHPLADDLKGLSLMPRFQAILLGSFAGVALFLAAVGLYGLLAYSVSRRVREIGVRMALGASGDQVLRLVVSESLLLVVAGITLGLVALAIYQLAGETHGTLVGVSPWDPVTLTAAPLVLLLAGLVASYLPARRATRVDPIVTLRTD